MGATDADGNEAKCGAATKSASHSPTSVQAVFEGPATPDSSAAELEDLLAAMGIDDSSVAARTAGAVFSGWSSPVGSPPQDNSCYQWSSWGSAAALSDDGGASLGGDLSAGAERRSQRASREERAAREAARQASNNAFVRSRQLIGSMKEEAGKAFQQAIDARVSCWDGLGGAGGLAGRERKCGSGAMCLPVPQQPCAADPPASPHPAFPARSLPHLPLSPAPPQRKGRLAEAAQFEREAQAWKCQAAAHRAKAARDAYRRNNGGASVNHMPDVNLHDLEVSQALKKVRSAVGERLGRGRAQFGTRAGRGGGGNEHEHGWLLRLA